MILLGVSALSITPLCCTCLEELSFPIPESLSINFMFFTSNLFSLVISMLVTLPQVGLYGTWILVGTLLPFNVYVLFFYKTDFYKSQHEGIYGSFNNTLENQNNQDISQENPESNLTQDISYSDGKSPMISQGPDNNYLDKINN